MDQMKKQIANIITFCRIPGSIGLLFCPVFSDCFYGLYIFCGLTDMVDGTIANKATGLCLFLLPLTISFVDLRYTAPVVCILATIAAFQEWYYIVTGRNVV